MSTSIADFSPAIESSVADAPFAALLLIESICDWTPETADDNAVSICAHKPVALLAWPVAAVFLVPIAVLTLFETDPLTVSRPFRTPIADFSPAIESSNAGKLSTSALSVANSPSS